MKGAKGEYLHMLTNGIHSAADLVSVSVLVTSVRSRTIFKYNFRWLRWYSKTWTFQSLRIIVLSTEQKNQDKVNRNIKQYKGWSLSADRLQEFLIRQTRRCADKRVVLDVGVTRSKAEYVPSAYSCGRCLFCSKSICIPTDMSRQSWEFLQLLVNNASKTEITEEVLIAWEILC
jgi:hypothetical protein